jgi:putative restriction endonuclease
MGMGDITAESVRSAIEECDRLGPAAFRSTYGFGSHQGPILLFEERAYDCKALIGVAHGYATGTFWRSQDIKGGNASIVRTLQGLGFDARTINYLPKPHPRARYGEIPNCPEGSTFASRAEARHAGVHRPLQAGICGTGEFGAESIVVSGGYVDDQDNGDQIIYTGHGGQDTRKRQVAHQKFEDSGNAALLTSCETGRPVRVVRGTHKGSTYAPKTGYRYDGLYRVVDAWQETGQHGFRVCRYELIKESKSFIDAPDHSSGRPAPNGTATPGRRPVTMQRLARSMAVSQYVKQLYKDKCQACGTRLVFPDGRAYSEGAHIRPLGRGHNGPDVPANVLCLCPNCHVLFDNGALIVDPTMTIWVNGQERSVLTVDDSHAIDAEHLDFHRVRFGHP